MLDALCLHVQVQGFALHPSPPSISAGDISFSVTWDLAWPESEGVSVCWGGVGGATSPSTGPTSGSSGAKNGTASNSRKRKKAWLM